MRVWRTPAFEEERDRFALRFCCEDCGHYDPRLLRCSHDWPEELHRAERYLSPTEDVVFCKEFELC